MLNFREVRQEIDDKIKTLLNGDSLSFLKDVFLNDITSKPDVFPWVLVTLVKRTRDSDSQNSRPAEEYWVLQYNVLVVTGADAGIGIRVSDKLDFVDAVEHAFLLERANGTFLSSDYVTDLTSDGVDYRDILMDNVVGAGSARDPRSLIQGGEFTLYVQARFVRS